MPRRVSLGRRPVPLLIELMLAGHQILWQRMTQVVDFAPRHSPSNLLIRLEVRQRIARMVNRHRMTAESVAVPPP